MTVYDVQPHPQAVRYTPGLLGDDFVLPRPHGLKCLYLRWFGLPDVRVHLTACYLLQALAPLSFASVLDVGCGNGMLSCLMAQRYPQCSILGVERHEASLIFATRLAEHNALHNVRFQLRNVERDRLVGQYDLITCFAVLQFIRDSQALLNRLNSALVSGGYLALQLPSAHATRFVMRLPAAHRRLPEFGEVRGGFTEAESRTLLAKSGFAVVQLRQVIKGPSILAKELFYLLASAHPGLASAFCPLFNWITVQDSRYTGPGNGMFIVARKSHEV